MRPSTIHLLSAAALLVLSQSFASAHEHNKSVIPEAEMALEAAVAHGGPTESSNISADVIGAVDLASVNELEGKLENPDGDLLASIDKVRLQVIERINHISINNISFHKKVRDAYGRTTLGQRLLLARRLVRAGVRYVYVSHGGYDNHERIFPTLRSRMSEFDRAYSALIADLDESGMLDSTMVTVTTEFGPVSSGR